MGTRCDVSPVADYGSVEASRLASSPSGVRDEIDESPVENKFR